MRTGGIIGTEQDDEFPCSSLGVLDAYPGQAKMGDYNAVKKGQVGRRMGRRVAGKATGKAIRRLSKITAEEFNQPVVYVLGASRPARRALVGMTGDSSRH